MLIFIRSLKSAVANIISKNRCTEKFKDMAASFQATINKIIFTKARNAIQIQIFNQIQKLKIVVAGGVLQIKVFVNHLEN